MRHWTLERLNTRFEELQTELVAIRLPRHPETDARKVERYRTIAALNLRIADLYNAAFKSSVLGKTHLELRAYLDSVHGFRASAAQWREHAARVAARQVGA